MKLLIHRNLREIQEIEATRVVVLDQYENPIAVAVEVSPGVIMAETVSEKTAGSFNQLLQNLGIDKTVMVSDVKTRPVSELHIPSI